MTKDAGFSTLELVMVLIVFAILSVIAVPNIFSWQLNAKLGNATRDLYSNIQKAKLEAIKRGRNCAVSFNETVNGSAYDYVIYMDENPTPNYRYDAGEMIITQKRWSEYGDLNIVSNTFDSSSGIPSFAFTPQGISQILGGGFSAGAIQLKNKNKQSGVVVSATGSVSIQ